MTSSVLNENARRWLRAIADAEGTLRDGQIGYNIMFGGGTFGDLSKHPDKVIRTPGYASAAAGAYQFMPATWGEAARALNLKDFGPLSQDLAARYLAKRRGVDIDTAAITPENVAKLAPEWASLPTLAGKSYYGQPVVSFSRVQQAAGTPSSGGDLNYAAKPTNEAEVDTKSVEDTSELALVMDALGLLGGLLNQQSGLSDVAARGRAELNQPTYIEDKADQTRTYDPSALARRRLNEQQNIFSSNINNALIQAMKAFQR